jgi:hypothetical protein
MSTTSLKVPAASTPAQQSTPTTPVSASAFGFADVDESQQERVYASSEARAAEQTRTAGGGQSAWLDGVSLLKSSEGVHFFRPIQFPGEANLIDEVDENGVATGRKLPRWTTRYKLYRVVDKTNNQDSGPIICKPGEDLLMQARIALFQNSVTAVAFKAQGKVFDISCSERIVFLILPFDGRGLTDAQLLDLPVSRPKNKKKPNDAPKHQVGDDLRDMPRLRDDDPIAMASRPPGTPAPLKFGAVYSLEKGRIVALNVQGKRETMVRTVEAKSVYPLAVGGVVKPEFADVLKAAFETYGKQPIEALLRYSTQEDQVNWVQSLAPAPFAEVALKAMGVKDIPHAAPVAAATTVAAVGAEDIPTPEDND